MKKVDTQLYWSTFFKFSVILAMGTTIAACDPYRGAGVQALGENEDAPVTSPAILDDSQGTQEKIYSLYKVYYSYKKVGLRTQRNCNHMQKITENMTRTECLDEKNVNRRFDKMTEERILKKETDFGSDDIKSLREYSKVVPDGPFQGKENYQYFCFKPAGIEAFSKHSCN